MDKGAMKQEAIAQWNKWHELQAQIKTMEGQIAQGDEFAEQYRCRLAELRKEEEAAQKWFERMLKNIQR